MPENNLSSAEKMQMLEEAQAQYLAILKEQGRLDEFKALEHKSWQERVGSAEIIALTCDVTIKFTAIRGHLNATLHSNQPEHYALFDGWPWGVGFDYGTGVGVYYGVDPKGLIGNCSYHCQGAAAGGGGIQITFWNSVFGALGQLNAVVGGVGGVECGGDDGVWTWAQ